MSIPIRRLAVACLLLTLTGCAPRSWKHDAAVQAARSACAGLDEMARQSCIQFHAVGTLNPEVCRLAGMWVDDACLQAVYEAAGDPAICERLYLAGVRPTCRAYYAGLIREALSTPAPLPAPARVADAALANLRPLTRSGLNFFGDWSPDGQALVYSMSTAPFAHGQAIYGERPPLLVGWMRADGGGARVLAEGHSPFFSPDGRTVFFRREVPNSGMSELWAVDLSGGDPRRLLEPVGGLTIHRLDGGRLVVSETGTYAPLRAYDPATGRLTEPAGPFPSNSPETARLSPDGTRLAYAQVQDVVLADADGSNAHALSQGGGFSAQVWWSPDSRFLAYTSGNHPTDRLVLADRDGRAVATLLPHLEESGYVSALAWSPDSRRLLVATDAYWQQPARPTRLTLFDTQGTGKVLLETYLTGVAWAPAPPGGGAGSLALGRWDGPQGELAGDDIWLAELTDQATLARLPAPTATPAPSPTPPLPLPAADLAPEDAIRRFWQAIDAHDTRTAWAAQASMVRARQGLATFQVDWQCVEHARVKDIRPMEGDERREMFEVQVEVETAAGCSGWMQPGPFTVVVREEPAGPWLIDSLNTGP